MDTKGIPVIEVKGLKKHFRYWAERPDNLKSFLVALMKGKMVKRQEAQITVLDGVDFEIHKGEFVGLMGRNGAGKSTLLRLLSGIYEPTEGSVKVRGNIAPLISLGAGFNPELTGYENIFLNAAVLGFGRQQTKDALESIIDFSELGDHIHRPIKNYSSGMVVRLGFSIAAHLAAEILLLDEILGVGDEGFQRKSLAKIFELHAQGRTVVLVNHSPDTIEQFCSRCIVINNGLKIFDGDAKQGAEVYRALFR
jgi:ABC-type polysaccharide/polyol phosphate transport system ATPase subunit